MEDAENARRNQVPKRKPAPAVTAGPSTAPQPLTTHRISTVPLDEISHSESAYQAMVEKRKREMAPKRKPVPAATAGSSSASASSRPSPPNANYGYASRGPYDTPPTASTASSNTSSTPSFDDQAQADAYELLTGHKVSVSKRHGPANTNKPSPPPTWESVQPFRPTFPDRREPIPASVSPTTRLTANASDFPPVPGASRRPVLAYQNTSDDPCNVNYQSQNIFTRTDTSNSKASTKTKRRGTLDAIKNVAKQAAHAVKSAGEEGVSQLRRAASFTKDSRDSRRTEKHNKRDQFFGKRQADYDAHMNHEATVAIENEQPVGAIFRAAQIKAEEEQRAFEKRQRAARRAQDDQDRAERIARKPIGGLNTTPPLPYPAGVAHLNDSDESVQYFAGQPDPEAKKKIENVRQIKAMKAKEAAKAKDPIYKLKKGASKLTDTALDAIALKDKGKERRNSDESLIGFKDSAPAGMMEPCRVCGREGGHLVYGKCPTYTEPDQSIPSMPAPHPNASTDSIPPLPTFGSSTTSVPMMETGSWSEDAALDELYSANKPRPNRFNIPGAASSIYSQATNAPSPSAIHQLVSASRTAEPTISGMASSVYSQATNQPGPSRIAERIAADNSIAPRIPGATTSIYSRPSNASTARVYSSSSIRPLNITKTGISTRYVDEADKVPSMSDLGDAQVGDRVEKDGVVYVVESSEECDCYRKECHLHHPKVVSRSKPQQKRDKGKGKQRRISPLMPLMEGSETNFASFDRFGRAEERSVIDPGKAKIIERTDDRSGSRSRAPSSSSTDSRSASGPDDDSVWGELVDRVNDFTTTRKLKPAALSYGNITKHTSVAGWRSSIAHSVLSGALSSQNGADDDGVCEEVPKTEAYYELMELLGEFSKRHGLPETHEDGVWPERSR